MNDATKVAAKAKKVALTTSATAHARNPLAVSQKTHFVRMDQRTFGAQAAGEITAQRWDDLDEYKPDCRSGAQVDTDAPTLDQGETADNPNTAPNAKESVRAASGSLPSGSSANPA